MSENLKVIYNNISNDVIKKQKVKLDNQLEESIESLKKEAKEYIIESKHKSSEEKNYLYYDEINSFMKISKIKNKEKFIDVYFDLVRKKFVNAINDNDIVDELDEVIDNYAKENIVIDKMKLIYLVALILMFYGR